MSSPRVDSSARDGLTILVVDDEPAMVGALGALLGQAGHRIVAAYDGHEAMRRFRSEQIDVVLLDLAMPGLDGGRVCREMRAESDAPIIIVSGERDESAPVELLALGADDYVRKPFRGDELLARIGAVMRRGRRPALTSAGRAAAWQLDVRRHEIRWRGVQVPATTIEFRLLRAMLERLGEVVSQADLLDAGWPGIADPDPLWLKPHLARLRDKLGGLGAPTPVAIRGVGYRLDE